MNVINAASRVKQIEEKIKNRRAVSLSEVESQSLLSPEERRKRRDEIQTRERGCQTTESSASYTIKRSSAPKSDSNIISAVYTPSINAADRAAQIRKQREIDYAKRYYGK